MAMAYLGSESRDGFRAGWDVVWGRLAILEGSHVLGTPCVEADQLGTGEQTKVGDPVDLKGAKLTQHDL